MSRLNDRIAKMEAQREAANPARRKHLVIVFDGETEEQTYLYGDSSGRAYPITDCVFMTEAEWIPYHIELEIEVGTPSDEAPAIVARELDARRGERLERRMKAEGRAIGPASHAVH